MADEEQIDHEQREELPLSKAVQYLLEECRMVLPGIQALFGFQLIAVLNPSFAQKLSQAEQRLHLLAIALAAVAVALIMTPAAYHRQTGPQEVSETFIRLSSRVLLLCGNGRRASMGACAHSMKGGQTSSATQKCF
jgi:hypothetical protein